MNFNVRDFKRLSAVQNIHVSICTSCRSGDMARDLCINTETM